MANATNQDLFGNLLVKNLYFEDQYNAILRTGLKGLNITSGDDKGGSNVFLHTSTAVSINSVVARTVRSTPDNWEKGAPTSAALDVNGLTVTDYLWVENEFRSNRLYIDTDLTVGNDATIGHDLTVGNIVKAKEADICCNLNVGHEAKVSEKATTITFGHETNKEALFTVNGKTTLGGDLAVTGGTVLANTDVKGALTVAGDSKTLVTLNVSASAVTKLALNIEKGKTNLGGDLTVVGATGLANTDINGALKVTGDSKTVTTLNVSASAATKVALNVEKGKTTLGGTLTVVGKTQLDDDLLVAGKVDLKSTLTVTGASNLKETNVNGNLDVTGKANIGKDLVVKGNTKLDLILKVGTDTGVYNDLYNKEKSQLKEQATVYGDAAIHGKLYADEIITNKKASPTVLQYSALADLPAKAIPGQLFFSRSSLYIYTPAKELTAAQLKESVVTDKGQWERVQLGEIGE